MRTFFAKTVKKVKKGIRSLFNARLLRGFGWSVFLAAVFMGTFAVFDPVAAQSTGAAAADWLVEGATNLLLVTARLAIGLTIFFLRFFITLASYNNYINTPVVQVGWIMVRDVANMFFVVALLVIAFGTILGIEQYEWKRGLVKLVLAAVFINFSNLLAQLFIDAAHIFTITFLNAIAATAGGNIIQMFQLTEILSFVQKPKIADVSNVRLELLGGAIMATFFAVWAAIAMGSYVIVMAARVVLLWVLIIMSPLAFIWQVLPATQGYAQKWWKEFKEQVIVAPIMVFFLWLTFATLGSGQIIRDIQDGNGKETNVIPLQSEGSEEIALSISKVTTWERMASFMVAIAFLFIGIKEVGESGAVGSRLIGSAVNFGKKVATIATGYATGRWLAGKASDAGSGVVGGIGKGLKFAAWKFPQVGGQATVTRWKNRIDAAKGWYYGKGMKTSKKGEEQAKELQDLHELKNLASKNPEERDAALAKIGGDIAALEQQKQQMQAAGAKDEDIARVDEKIARKQKIVADSATVDPDKLDETIKKKTKAHEKEMTKAGGIWGKMARQTISREKQAAKTEKQAEYRRKILWKRTGSEAGGYTFGNIGKKLGLGIGMGTKGLFRTGLFGDPKEWDRPAQDRYERGWLKAEEMRSAAKDREVEQKGKLDVLLKPRLKFDVNKGTMSYEAQKGTMMDRITWRNISGEVGENVEQNASTEQRQKYKDEFEKSDDKVRAQQQKIDQIDKEKVALDHAENAAAAALQEANEMLHGAAPGSAREKELIAERDAAAEKLAALEDGSKEMRTEEQRDQMLEAAEEAIQQSNEQLAGSQSEGTEIDEALAAAKKSLKEAEDEEQERQKTLNLAITDRDNAETEAQKKEAQKRVDELEGAEKKATVDQFAAKVEELEKRKETNQKEQDTHKQAVDAAQEALYNAGALIPNLTLDQVRQQKEEKQEEIDRKQLTEERLANEMQTIEDDITAREESIAKKEAYLEAGEGSLASQAKVRAGVEKEKKELEQAQKAAETNLAAKQAELDTARGEREALEQDRDKFQAHEDSVAGPEMMKSLRDTIQNAKDRLNPPSLAVPTPEALTKADGESDEDFAARVKEQEESVAKAQKENDKKLKRLREDKDKAQKEYDSVTSGEKARDLDLRRAAAVKKQNAARKQASQFQVWDEETGERYSYGMLIDEQAKGKLMKEKLAKEEEDLVQRRMSEMFRDAKSMDSAASRLEAGAYGPKKQKEQIQAIQKAISEKNKELTSARQKENQRAQDLVNMRAKQDELNKAREAAEKDPQQAGLESIKKELQDIETAIKTQEDGGKGAATLLKQLRSDSEKLKKDLTEAQGELRVKADKLRAGDSSIARQVSDQLREESKAAKEAGNDIEAKKLESESNTWAGIATKMDKGGSLGWSYGVAHAKSAETSRLYRYSHNLLLSDAEQREIWDNRQLDTPVNTLTELIEEFERGFSQMSYDQFVQNAGSMFMGMMKKQEAGTITDGDRAALMGLFKRGMNSAWMDDAIISIMENDESREQIASQLGWKDQVFSTDKIRDVEMLFASGGDVKFAAKNVVMSDLQDVGVHDLGMNEAGIIQGLKDGNLVDKNGNKVTGAQMKEKVMESLKRQRRQLTAQQEEWLDMLTKDAGRQVDKTDAFVESYLDVLRTNSSQMQYLGNIRDDAIKGGHGENAGWALARDIGNGEKMYMAMGLRSARNHVMGDVNKTDLRLRAKAHPHMVADLDEENGQIITKVRMDDLATIRNGIDYRTHSGTTGRYTKLMSGIGASDSAHKLMENGRLRVGKSKAAQASFKSRNAGMFAAKTAGMSGQQKAQMEEALTARGIVQDIFAPQMATDQVDFALNLASTTGENKLQAANKGAIRLTIPIIKPDGSVGQKTYSKVQDLTQDIRAGVFGHISLDIPDFTPPDLSPEELAQQQQEYQNS